MTARAPCPIQHARSTAEVRPPPRQMTAVHGTVRGRRCRQMTISESSGLSRRTLLRTTAAAGAAAAATTVIPAGAASAAPAAAGAGAQSVAAQQKADKSGSIPTPESYFGFRIGSDGNLATWDKMVP